MTRFFPLLAVLIGCLFVSGDDPVFGQPPPVAGTVSWATGYPTTKDSVPPNTFGSVTVFGDYTENQGWAAKGALFYYNNAGGGTPTPVILEYDAGKLGVKQNMQMVPGVVTLVKGKYQGWLAVVYRDTKMPPGPDTSVISTVVNFEIK